MPMRVLSIAVLLAALASPSVGQEAAGKVHAEQTDLELRAAKALDTMFSGCR